MKTFNVSILNDVKYDSHQLNLLTIMSGSENGWSVASVFTFNTWGIAPIHSYPPAPTFDLRAHLPLHPPAPGVRQPNTNTDSVADCIRQLGYTVQCGRGGEGRRGTYTIISISKKKFYYGSEFGAQYQHLSGKRTIYERFLAWRASWRAALNCHQRGFGTDVEVARLEEKKKLQFIDEGSICNKSEKNWHSWETGASTIGNTLPNDIVQALQDFRSDCPNFVREPDCEFYIPPSMQETPDACPPPESTNNQGGGAGAAVEAVAVSQQAVAASQPATTSKKTHTRSDSSSSSSDSSDSEDD